MYRYAQIDKEGYVVSDSWLSGEVDDKNMIPVAADFDLANKRYVNGAWESYIPEPITTEQPTQMDRIEEIVASTALTTEYMACLQEVNAE